MPPAKLADALIVIESVPPRELITSSENPDTSTVLLKPSELVTVAVPSAPRLTMSLTLVPGNTAVVPVTEVDSNPEYVSLSRLAPNKSTGRTSPAPVAPGITSAFSVDTESVSAVASPSASTDSDSIDDRLIVTVSPLELEVSDAESGPVAV